MASRLEGRLHQTTDERHEIEKLLGARIADADWRRLVNAGDVQPGMDEGAIEDAAALVKKWNEADEFSPKRRVSVTIQPDDPRYDALTEIFALEASEDATVAAWRKEHLQGRLLEASELHEWIGRYLTHEPIGEVLKTYVEGPDGTTDGLPISVQIPTLRYVHPDGRPHFVPVSRTGPLGQLAQIAQALVRRFHWPESEAASFILTGVPPSPAFVRAELSLAESPATSRLIVTADPRTPTTRLLQAVKAVLNLPSAQQIIGTKSIRALRSSAPDLAIFLARNHTLSWSQLVKRWNNEHPELQYLDQRKFSRDAHQAWQRVVGSDFFLTSKWFDTRAESSRSNEVEADFA